MGGYGRRSARVNRTRPEGMKFGVPALALVALTGCAATVTQPG
jgi:hypothetical protein